MKLKNLFILFFLLTSLTIIDSYSQTGIVLPILIESPDARYSGMGNAGTAIANDVYATYINPGGLGFLKQKIEPGGFLSGESIDDIPSYLEGAISYSILPLYTNSPKTNLNITAGSYFESLSGTLALDFTYEGLGEMTRTSENGTSLGKTHANNFIFGLAYGTTFGNDWGFGVKFKFIQSNLATAPVPPNYYTEETMGSSSYAFDIGVLWRPQKLNLLGMELGNVISLGANLKNIGPGVSYNILYRYTYKSPTEPIPTQLRLGAGFNLLHNKINDLMVAFDVSKLLVYNSTTLNINGVDTTYKTNSDGLPKSLITGWKSPGVDFGLGAEYWYMHLIAFRA
ncbi:MAG: PorV/PorQ family protein [FCB group bacterium]